MSITWRVGASIALLISACSTPTRDFRPGTVGASGEAGDSSSAAGKRGDSGGTDVSGSGGMSDGGVAGAGLSGAGAVSSGGTLSNAGNENLPAGGASATMSGVSAGTGGGDLCSNRACDPRPATCKDDYTRRTFASGVCDPRTGNCSYQPTDVGCPSAPENGTPSCSAGVCSYSCNSGFHKCGSDCAADAATSTEFVHPVYGCGHRFKPNAGDATWVTFLSGLNVDEGTGYGWYDPHTVASQANAIVACASNTVAGLQGWTLPTISQTRTLAAGCATTAPGGSCALGTTCLSQSCGSDAVACEACLGGGGPNAGAYCRPNVQLCDFSLTSSMCSDCVAPKTIWMYLPGNGNFVTAATTAVTGYLCVRTSVPNY